MDLLSIINNGNISASAKGVLVYMLSRGEDWFFDKGQLIKHFKEGKTAINNILKELHDLEILIVNPPDVLGIEAKLKKSKHVHDLGIGSQRCTWCNIKTIKLHRHHHPIQKKDGGRKTVDICPNCHQEFHSLMSKSGRTKILQILYTQFKNL